MSLICIRGRGLIAIKKVQPRPRTAQHRLQLELAAKIKLIFAKLQLWQCSSRRKLCQGWDPQKVEVWQIPAICSAGIVYGNILQIARFTATERGKATRFNTKQQELGGLVYVERTGWRAENWQEVIHNSGGTERREWRHTFGQTQEGNLERQNLDSCVCEDNKTNSAVWFYCT